MKGLRFALALAGLLGIAAMFLRYWMGIEGSMWDYRKVEPLAVYVPLGCFGLGVLAAAFAQLGRGLARWQAVIALVGFTACFASEWVRKGLISDAGIKPALGGKLLFAAAVAGLVVALVGVARPEKA
jgi:hypothetical protein